MKTLAFLLVALNCCLGQTGTAFNPSITTGEWIDPMGVHHCALNGKEIQCGQTAIASTCTTRFCEDAQDLGTSKVLRNPNWKPLTHRSSRITAPRSARVPRTSKKGDRCKRSAVKDGLCWTHATYGEGEL